MSAHVEGALGMNAKGQRITRTDKESGLRGPQVTYSNDFEANYGLLSTKDACFWETNL